MKYLSIIILFVILTGCFGITPQKTGKEGKPMPDFNILLSDNTVLHTRDIPSDKSVVLFYFSPYCPFCKAVTQNIIEDMDDLNKIRFYFITSYGLSDMEDFIKEHQLTKYTNITVGIDTANFIHKYYNAEGVPYIAIFKKNKILNNSFLGKISTAQIKDVAEE
jgi:thiol-disulfide isomerase/thioredoxin